MVVFLLASVLTIAAFPTKAFAATASDNFNRSNGALGANWTTTNGDGAFNVSSNTALGTAGGSNNNAGAYWSANTFGSDQFSQVEVTSTQPSGGSWLAASVRVQNSLYGDLYAGLYFNNYGTYELMIFKRINSAYTEIDSGAYVTSALAAGTQLDLIASGSNLYFQENGTTEVSATDTSLTGGQPGIEASSSDYLDNWTGGDYSVTPSASLLQSDPTPSATGVQDGFGISGVTLSAIKCIKISYLTTLAGGGVKPTGMSVASATLDSSSTWPASPASWTVADDNVNGIVTLTYATGSTPAMSASRWLQLDSITNPSSTGTYYVTLTSYTSTGCSTGQVDSFSLASSVNGAVTVSATIDPAFTFAVANQASACNGESNFVTGAGTATAVALGHLSAGSNVSGGQVLSITGNAGNGFVVYVRGTQATQDLRNATHNWSDVTGSYATPAVLGAGERFGYTYKDSTASSSVTNPASAKFIALTNATTNAVMGSTTSESGTACVSYDAEAASTTPAGSYAGTVIYTAVPTF